MSSRYAASAPSRAEDELEAFRQSEEASKFCSVPNCRTRYPGRGRPNLQGFADMRFTASDGSPVRLCCKHYDELLYRAGKGRMCDITGNQPELTLQLVREHWQRLDLAASAKARLSGLEDNFA